MEDFKEIEKLENLSGKLIFDSDFKNFFQTPKNHYTLHYCPFIMMFESPENFSSQAGENAHISKVKENYMKSDKKKAEKFVRNHFHSHF